jgi:hypothetical protein
VVRLLDVRPPVADKRGVGVDREREPGVYLAVLPGQQVLVHRLPDQRVPERVPICGGHQHVAGDRGPNRGGQLVLGPAGDPGEQRMTGAAASGARDAEHLLGVFRQPPHRLLEQVGERVRYIGAARAGEQLLGEERVAFCPLVEGVGQRAVRRAAEDRRREFFRLPAAQPWELGPLDPVDPGQFGEQRPERMGPVQLVGAECHDDQHVAQRPLVADEEGDQVPA